MKCSTVKVGGTTAIVCGRQRVYSCIECGAPAPHLCDWRLGPKRTCDRPLCDTHTVSPAQGKDLCPHHAAMWAVDPRNRTLSEAP